MAEQAKDYLAVITVNGVGSWARETDREKAIKNAIRRFKADFNTYFKLEKGKVINIDVLDVTGQDTVWWDDRCFYTKNDKPFDGPVERIERTL